jgi:hypothetical protein
VLKQLKPRIDPDELDLEQILATLESPGWRMIGARLEASRARELAKLAVSDTWENARFGQGVLAGLQMAAEIPKILGDEIRARSAKKRRSGDGGE